jgi:dienelactone hydrolase
MSISRASAFGMMQQPDQNTWLDFGETAARRSLQALVEQLGTRATLKLFHDADHSFHVPARAGRADTEIRSEMLDAVTAWVETVV